jgi:hypothetical protein
MRTFTFFVVVFSVLIITGCSGSVLPGNKNIHGNVLYNETGDFVQSGTVIFDNGTDLYRAEISNGFCDVAVPAGNYKVWFENIEPLPVQAQYLSQEKTPVKAEVFGGKQNVLLQVHIDRKAKKR